MCRVPNKRLGVGLSCRREEEDRKVFLFSLPEKVGAETKQIVSGIRQFYTAEQMVGKTIIVVNNLLPSNLRGETSYGMLLAVRLPDGTLRLVTTDGPAPSGLAVS